MHSNIFRCGMETSENVRVHMKRLFWELKTWKDCKNFRITHTTQKITKKFSQKVEKTCASGDENNEEYCDINSQSHERRNYFKFFLPDESTNDTQVCKPFFWQLLVSNRTIQKLCTNFERKSSVNSRNR